MALGILSSKFFEEYSPDLGFFTKWKALYAWNSQILPIYEWDNVLFVGCSTTPPENIASSQKVVFLFCEGEVLKKIWYELEGTLAVVNPHSKPIPAEVNITKKVPDDEETLSLFLERLGQEAESNSTSPKTASSSIPDNIKKEELQGLESHANELTAPTLIEDQALNQAENHLGETQFEKDLSLDMDFFDSEPNKSSKPSDTIVDLLPIKNHLDEKNNSPQETALPLEQNIPVAHNSPLTNKAPVAHSHPRQNHQGKENLAPKQDGPIYQEAVKVPLNSPPMDPMDELLKTHEEASSKDSTSLDSENSILSESLDLDPSQGLNKSEQTHSTKTELPEGLFGDEKTVHLETPGDLQKTGNPSLPPKSSLSKQSSPESLEALELNPPSDFSSDKASDNSSDRSVELKSSQNLTISNLSESNISENQQKNIYTDSKKADSSKVRPKTALRSPPLDSWAESSFREIKLEYQKVMILIRQGDQYRPWRWCEDFTATHPNNISFSVTHPSPFRIVSKTHNSYHGYVVESETAKKFFEQWNQSESPEVLTMAPLIYQGSILGILLALGPKTADTKGCLQLIEDKAAIIAQHLHVLQAA